MPRPQPERGQSTLDNLDSLDKFGPLELQPFLLINAFGKKGDAHLEDSEPVPLFRIPHTWMTALPQWQLVTNPAV